MGFFMKLNPFVMMREEFDGTGIVFDPDRNKAISLNSTGVAVWKVLASGGTEADAIHAILTEFSDVTEAQAKQDVAKFFGVLREKGLLTDE